MLHNLDLDIHLFTYLKYYNQSVSRHWHHLFVFAVLMVIVVIVSCFSDGPGLAWHLSFIATTILFLVSAGMFIKVSGQTMIAAAAPHQDKVIHHYCGFVKSSYRSAFKM